MLCLVCNHHFSFRKIIKRYLGYFTGGVKGGRTRREQIEIIIMKVIYSSFTEILRHNSVHSLAFTWFKLSLLYEDMNSLEYWILIKTIQRAILAPSLPSSRWDHANLMRSSLKIIIWYDIHTSGHYITALHFCVLWNMTFHTIWDIMHPLHDVLMIPPSWWDFFFFLFFLCSMCWLSGFRHSWLVYPIIWPLMKCVPGSQLKTSNTHKLSSGQAPQVISTL